METPHWKVQMQETVEQGQSNNIFENKRSGDGCLHGTSPHFSPLMAPLDHIGTNVDNTVVYSWASRGSVSSAAVVSPILREASCICWQTKTYTSVSDIVGVDNHEADAASRLTHLTVA